MDVFECVSVYEMWIGVCMFCIVVLLFVCLCVCVFSCACVCVCVVLCEVV